MQADAIVIGAGVSGLSTAVVLAERGHAVVVVADEDDGGSTSYAAGAMCGPDFWPAGTVEAGWERTSRAAFRDLASRPGTGIHLTSALLVAEGASSFPPVDADFDPRPCDTDELPPGFGGGVRVTIATANMPAYLAYLRDRLAEARGRVEAGRFASLSEAAAQAPLVANCAGMGARALADDPTLVPVRGQHVVVANPGVDELYFQMTFGHTWTSWMPHGDEVVLGGIAQAGDWRRDPDPEIAERILEGCTRLEPRFADAETLEHRVGLRPGRPRVRVEAEEVDGARCVHNYGHGGTGVILSWGCAHDAADLLTGP